jgi:hypothetical protein
MADSRSRAVALRAVSIGEVLTAAGFILILSKLTAAQRQKLQRYLDAAVVDPVVRDEAKALYQKGTKYYGKLTVMDPQMERRAQKVMADFIPVGDLDDCVRLNAAQVFDEKTFAPTTDNPDEADYLENVRKTLEARGVWLRLAPKLVRDAADPSRWANDHRHFEAWLSLGPRGDAIPTASGRIDREALLRNRTFGAGYYEHVDKGAVQRALEHEMQRLSSEIDDGMQQHAELGRIRHQAAPGVVAVSDVLGGADFPSIDIWNGPSRLLVRARELNGSGKIYSSRAYLTLAAVSVHDAAHLLSHYVGDTTSGAERAVKILKVAKTAGQVAEVALAVTGVGYGAIKLLSVEAEVPRLARLVVERQALRDPELVQLVRMPKGSISGYVKGGHSSGAGTGFWSWSL